MQPKAGHHPHGGRPARHAGAPSRARARPRKPSKLSGWATPRPSGFRLCGNASPAIIGERYRVQRCARARRGDLGLLGRLRARLPRRARSGRRACCCRRPAIPATGRSSSALGAKPVLIETGAATRWMPDLADVDRLARRGRPGFLLASPNNPTGTMVGARAARRACRGLPAPRPLADLRRDLSRPRI